MHDEIRTSNPIATVFWLLVFVVLLAGVLHQLVRAVEAESVNQALYYGKPVTATYERPAAFRLQSPTAAQMDAVDHLLVVQQVAR